MRFDVALMHRTGGEGALDHHLRLLETLRDVALLDFKLASDIRRLAFELVELVQDRRVRLERVVDLDCPRQHFVVDLDQFAGLGRDRFRGGGDRRDGMAREQRLLACHHVAAHPAHVLDAEHDRLVDREVDDVARGDHRLDAR